MDSNIIVAPKVDDKPVFDNKFDKLKMVLLEFFSKKNIKIIITVVLMLIALILYVGFSGSSSKEAEDEKASTANGYITTMEYCEKLEEKLQAIISQIDGAGNVKVMVSVDGSPELIYVSDTDTKTSTTTSGTTTTTTSSPIIVGSGSNSNGIVMTEKLPRVKGVIVVSTGAGQIGIKLDILNAVATLLDISTDNITILKGV